MNNKQKSFTQFEKTCEYHFATLERLCYCELTGETCNKINCPKFEIRGTRKE